MSFPTHSDEVKGNEMFMKKMTGNFCVQKKLKAKQQSDEPV